MSDLNLMLACPRGLETVLSDEVRAITGKTALIDKGMVRLPQANREDMYRLNLHVRTASRIVMQLARGAIKTEDDVYRLARAVPWQNHFTPENTIKVHCEGRGARVKSLNFIALKVKDALCDAFRDSDGRRPSVDKAAPDVRIEVFLNDKEAFIYLDTSGEALFKRGYRRETGDAPLRENLAAGLLLLAGYDGSQAFFDPMCGSGTLPIEAALIASRRAPGLQRSFAFEKLKGFDAALWQKIRAAAQAAHITPPAPLYAADRSSVALKHALENARAAGVDDVIRFNRGELSAQHAPTEAGLLLCNPPYGERLGELDEIRAEYPSWSSCLKQEFAGWTAGFITADTEFPRRLRLAPQRKIPLYNGALECRLYLFEMVAGSNRKVKETPQDT
ncbi:MAG: THUMP domain-containing protein [Neisseria sp.]|nr:THUMP domain-containing protein [Neisseria sp.]